MNEIKYSTSLNSLIYQDSVAIRTEVFVNEQNVPKELEIDDLENKCTYFVLYKENKAVACARFFPTADNGIHVQRVAVLKEYRHKNLGTELLNYIFNFVTKENYSYIVLGAQDHAQNFL